MNCFHVIKSAFATLAFMASATALHAAQPATVPGGQPAAQQIAKINWVSWSDAAFEKARNNHKLVLLDLQAVWCHWCHVQDDITYADPSIIAEINRHFVAIKVDQDSRPDLANRWEDYGWPATIVLDANGKDLIRRSGYIPPEPMLRMLKAVVADPTPGPSVQPEIPLKFAIAAGLDDALRTKLQAAWRDGYDEKMGGWGQVHKYLDWDNTEYAMAQSAHGDAAAKNMARATLDGQMNLLDPAWGGVYQYSTDDDWTHPHFEKLMTMQAGNLRIFALAYRRWGDAKYLRAAREIESFMRNFLESPEGAFYVSQDADLIDGQHAADYFALPSAARRRLGIPRVDQHIYSSGNGLAIVGLVELYDATGDASILDEAITSAQWVIAHRTLPGGGFSHDVNDAAGPYLDDNLAMAQAFLMLYQATTQRPWLDRAVSAMQFIDLHFTAPDAGFATAQGDTNHSPQPQVDENVGVARVANLLFYYTGNAAFSADAKKALRFVCTPEIALHRRFLVGGILLADDELRTPPLHITIVGSKQDPQAAALFQAALRSPTDFRRLEWWDPADGPLPNADVEYPQLKKAAAFVCTNNTCSSPIQSVDKLQARLLP